MSTSATVPAVVLNAADNMLQPFGINLRELLSKAAEERPTLTKKYLTIAEAEEFYCLGRMMIYRASRAGFIRTVKPGGSSRNCRVLIDRDSLEAWINGTRQPEA